MKKWQTTSFVCALVILFVGINLSGILIGSNTTPTIAIPEANNLQSKAVYVINFDADLDILNDSLTVSDDVIIDPSEPINGTIYNTTEIINCNDFYIVDTVFPVLLTLQEVNIARDFVISGGPTVTMVDVNVSRNITSNNFGATTIGSPTISFTNVITPLLRIQTTAGTMSLTSCTVTNMSIKGGLIVTISADTTVTNIFETVVPTVTPTQSSITVPFSFLFQPTASVSLSWTGQDNIQGPNYPLNYTLRILKNGVYDSTITNIATTSYNLPIDTAVAVYTIELTATDGRGNVSNISTIVVVPTAELLWFILTIIIIAGAAVAVIFLIYTLKQRQWQKTSLMEIPT